MKVRTRFAPSPTGYLHVGGIRTALFAYAFAKNQGGDFLLRIEDTDKAREVEGSIEHIKESLNWLGINWDEDIVLQSDRLEIYQQWAQKLIESGFAYTDNYSEQEVQAFRQTARENKQAFLFRNHRPENPIVEDDWYGRLPLRFKTPEAEETTWHDEVRGELKAGTEALDDFVLIKADGYPTYNFAHVIDDHLMHITHVMRGEEFLPSVPKYIALHKALGIELPKYATMPPILGKGGGKKLSKRDGAKDVLEYREEGILSEAVFNFIASLGWNDGTDEEIFTPQEIIERFDLSRIQRSGAQFDEDKLAWVNWQHIKRLIDGNTISMVSKFGLGEDMVGALKLAASKANSPETLDQQLEIFTAEPVFNTSDDLSIVDGSLNKEIADSYLHEAASAIESLEAFTLENIESALRNKMQQLEAKPRAFLNLVRWAVSGQQVSPNLFEMIEVLGKDKSLARLKAASN